MIGAKTHCVIIGAGIGGLATALRLAASGFDVTVLERHEAAGGKIRTLPSTAGPVDAGPTVFTMRRAFDSLFEAAGTELEDHLTIVKEPLLARHFWPDGGQLDLFDDPRESAASVEHFAGACARRDFEAFSKNARKLFETFDDPVIQSAEISMSRVSSAAAFRFDLMPFLMPTADLASALKKQFSDPRLAQLFGRYATYVGGSPYQSPALLMLIAHSEAMGVWRVKGGMIALAQALQRLAEEKGATFQFGAHVSEITSEAGRATGVVLDSGETLAADYVVFNGDPAALSDGSMQGGTKLPADAIKPRSLSAYVWAFASAIEGVELAHHNVFFNNDYAQEFKAIAAGTMPDSATLYVCAQDRGSGETLEPGTQERFEIIMNGPATDTNTEIDAEEYDKCCERTFPTLAQMGLQFRTTPLPEALTRPRDFARLFPGSHGSLYGRSPHGMMASFQRPHTASLTRQIRGLYLAGGGVHPGAGVPMALTSGKHAAEAILTAHALH